MALPNASLVQTALQEFYSAFTNDKTVIGMRAAVDRVNWLAGALNRLYPAPTAIAIVDSADAGVSEFVAAEGSISVGTIFRITSTTEDLTDNAFGTAKNAEGDGSVVALNDIYVISGADAVVYLGNNADSNVFDMNPETVADFVNI